MSNHVVRNEGIETEGRETTAPNTTEEENIAEDIHQVQLRVRAVVTGADDTVEKKSIANTASDLTTIQTTRDDDLPMLRLIEI